MPPKKPQGAQRKKNGYVMPKKLPVGTTLQDTSKTQWISGPSIGVGGFGEIYSACRADAKSKNAKDYPCVIKIEPHGNGPLFVEMHFYMRNAKLEEIENFKKSRKLKHLGMPHYIGSGSHELQGEKHRFVVMPRYGSDIWSLYLKNSKKFPDLTVFRLAVQMLDVLEYIHSCTYVHADLKGANILLGFGKDGDSRAFLVDFGLACHYTTASEYKPDPKKKHDGTIEYTSRDAHNGVPTMRGDMEILAYNLIHWCGATLPWEKDLKDPVKVQQGKEKAMSDIKTFMKECFPKTSPPPPVVSFTKYVSELQYRDTPDYTKCRKFFTSAIGTNDKGPLEFGSVTPTAKTPTRGRKRVSTIEISDEDSPGPVPPKRSRKPTTPPKTAASATTSQTVHLATPAKDAKKVYHFNIDLDVSVDADVVVNVNRKKKEKKETPKKNDTLETVNESSEDSFVAETKKKRTTKKTVTVSKTNSREKKELHVAKAVARAGEYKGKKAKE